MRQTTLYICYYTVTEPLVQTQVLSYLAELSSRGIDVTLLSFEPLGVSPEALARSAEFMDSSGIRWRRLRYHSRPSLVATLFDIAIGTMAAAWLCIKYNIRIIHARSHVPAAVGLLLKRVLGLRLIFDMRGLLADEYVDAGHWSKRSARFRLTKRMEAAFLIKADGVIMLTQRIRSELASAFPRFKDRISTTDVIPCCIDADRFSLGLDDREAYRAERGWSGRKVIVYAGKVGGWYMTHEMIDFFAAARRQDDRIFIQVLTQGDRDSIQALMLAVGLEPCDFDVRCVSPADLPRILNACDAGLSFIKPCYSKLASSPTKVAEYLGAGLAVVTGPGIGDCDEVFSDPKLGIVISEFNGAEYHRACLRLSEMFNDSFGAEHRRGYAVANLSIQNIGGPRYLAAYDRLLGPAVALPGISRTAES